MCDGTVAGWVRNDPRYGGMSVEGECDGDAKVTATVNAKTRRKAKKVTAGAGLTPMAKRAVIVDRRKMVKIPRCGAMT